MMSNMIKPPWLSMAFSKDGKGAKRRFANILEMNPKRRGTIAFIFVILTVFLFGGCVQKNEKNSAVKDTMNLIVAGKDASGGRNDVVLLCSLNDESLEIMQIPEKTFVGVTGGSRISQMHTPQELRWAVKEISGVDCKNYISIDFEGLRSVIDAMGGIDFEVPADMHYENPYQSLTIDLSAGWQHLDGEHTEMLMRYKQDSHTDSAPVNSYDNADMTRLTVQRELYYAIADQILKKGVSSKLAEVTVKNFDSNLSLKEFQEILRRAANLKHETISVTLLKGENMLCDDGVAYYIPEALKMADIPKIHNEQDTIQFTAKVQSVRVWGTEYSFRKVQKWLTLYNERMDEAFVQCGGTAADGLQIRVKGTVNGLSGESKGKFTITCLKPDSRDAQ